MRFVPDATHAVLVINERLVCEATVRKEGKQFVFLLFFLGFDYEAESSVELPLAMDFYCQQFVVIAYIQSGRIELYRL